MSKRPGESRPAASPADGAEEKHLRKDGNEQKRREEVVRYLKTMQDYLRTILLRHGTPDNRAFLTQSAHDLRRVIDDVETKKNLSVQELHDIQARWEKLHIGIVGSVSEEDFHRGMDTQPGGSRGAKHFRIHAQDPVGEGRDQDSSEYFPEDVPVRDPVPAFVMASDSDDEQSQSGDPWMDD